MRNWYHLTREQDKLMINKSLDKYDLLSNERKNEVKKFVISTEDTCFGKPRLVGTRIWIEIAVGDYLNNELHYLVKETNFNENDLFDIIIVWFFDDWMHDPYYLEKDYEEDI